MKKIFVLCLFALLGGTLAGCGKKKVDYSKYTLQDYRDNAGGDKNSNLVFEYLKENNIDASQYNRFKNCLSEESGRGASLTFKAKEVLGWCKAEYDRAPTLLDKKINLDPFYAKFSGWDGSYRPLEQLIKSHMNDPSSYSHEKTTVLIVMPKDGSAPYANVRTTFRGKNVFGGTVLNSVLAKVDVRTGQVIKIIE
ncbi:MAG: hypothetical protein KIG68_01390 [Oxalobacter sp.]|nr:hypothetical protein [Oxalobacter sp.]